MGRSVGGESLSRPMSSENISLARKGHSSLFIVVVAALFHMSSELHADSFVMTSGKVIDGTVADGSDISVFIKDEDGLLKSVMVADIAEVQVDLRNGAQIVGRLAGFHEDVYEIISDGRRLYVEDGRVVQTSIVRSKDAPAVIPNAGGPAIDVDTQDDATDPHSGNDYDSDILRRAPL